MAQTHEGALKLAARAAGLTLEEFRRRRAKGLHRCSKCNEWKPRDEFATDRSRLDDCAKKCHACVRKPSPKTKHLWKPGQPSAFKGRKHSDEARALLAEKSKGNKRRVGTKHTPETRAKIAAITRERTPRGKDHPAYRHGAMQRNLSLRRTPEYLVWRKAVFERDNYTCQDCGDRRGGNLRAHHEKPMGEFPELAYEVSNGVTLCHPCHELRHFKPDSIRNVRKLKRGERLWK